MKKPTLNLTDFLLVGAVVVLFPMVVTKVTSMISKPKAPGVK